MGTRRSDIIVMMGDFNAQVWNNNQDTEHVMGRHGMPCDKENEKGQHLIKLCGKHGLVIGGTIFPHKGHKVTWISADKDKQGGNQIDHICTRSVRKVSDRIFLCEHLMDYNLARLHEPTLNLSAHA